jgi:hypothetical protein
VKSIEDIYNSFLKVSRKRKNLPFNPRKDFSDIEHNKDYNVLLRLDFFFKRNPYINLIDFFESPYDVYQDEDYFPLNFYLTQKAVKVYSLYQKKKIYSDPDSEIQKKAVIDGMSFVYDFCKKEHITLDEYLNHKTNNMATIFLHLKQKNISIYNCLSFENFQQTLNNHNYELLEFMLGDVISKISIFRTKYYASKKCMKITKQGLKILKEKLAKYK